MYNVFNLLFVLLLSTVNTNVLVMSGTTGNLVNDGEEVNVTCRTGSSNPVVPVVWKRANNPQLEHVNDVLISGPHEGTITLSTITIQVKRQLHQQTYQCCLQYTDPICSDLWELKVRCTYTLLSNIFGKYII